MFWIVILGSNLAVSGLWSASDYPTDYPRPFVGNITI